MRTSALALFSVLWTTPAAAVELSDIVRATQAGESAEEVLGLVATRSWDLDTLTVVKLLRSGVDEMVIAVMTAGKHPTEGERYLATKPGDAFIIVPTEPEVYRLLSETKADRAFAGWRCAQNPISLYLECDGPGEFESVASDRTDTFCDDAGVDHCVATWEAWGNNHGESTTIYAAWQQGVEGKLGSGVWVVVDEQNMHRQLKTDLGEGEVLFQRDAVVARLGNAEMLTTGLRYRRPGAEEEALSGVCEQLDVARELDAAMVRFQKARRDNGRAVTRRVLEAWADTPDAVVERSDGTTSEVFMAGGVDDQRQQAANADAAATRGLLKDAQASLAQEQAFRCFVVAEELAELDLEQQLRHAFRWWRRHRDP